MAALCHLRLVYDGWAEGPGSIRRRARGLARQALEVGGERSAHPCERRFVLAYFGEDIGAMIGLVDRALALNPSFARGWFVSGPLRLWPGNPIRDRAS